MARRWIVLSFFAVLIAVGIAVAQRNGAAVGTEEIIVVAYNDLGMHCMNDDFSDLMILPPFNTLRAQVIKRGPDIVHGNDATVRFSIPSNTRSTDKSNFWVYDEQLLGVDLPPDVGLTGTGMSGVMTPTAHRTYEAVGIPITPIDDTGRLNPYPLALIEAVHHDGMTASTVTVVPVSSELTCNLCHQATGVSTGIDILRDHDKLHGTDLEANRPVLCAGCHADNALGLPGKPGLPALSHAIHGAHAPRMDLVSLDNECYACHPGIRTKCQRGNHFAAGLDCSSCHGGMSDVGNIAREPWVDLPRCGDCHSRPGFEFEQPGTLYKDSVGHGGVMCATCHGSPHATTPSVAAADNRQSILLQGHAGPLDDCLLCHQEMPSDPFPHRNTDD